MDRAEHELAQRPLPADTVGLLEGLCSTRSIRRYTDEPVPPEILRSIVFAATRAPTGSNRQPFRFLVLTDGPKAAEAKHLVGIAARQLWERKRAADGYDQGSGGQGSGATGGSPKSRVAQAMQSYVDHFEQVPALLLPCLVRYREPSPAEGASIYPACQNILLAARALGYGGVLSRWHEAVETQLAELLGIPQGVVIAATITIGKPAGNHGPVRRRPIGELVFDDSWGNVAPWAVDPPGTRFTSAGLPGNGIDVAPAAFY